jgi:hypothetical protein
MAGLAVPYAELCSPRTLRPMPTVIPNKPEDCAFDPEDTTSMAAAFEDVCQILKVHGNRREREVLAARIIDFARDGERNRNRLRKRVLIEVGQVYDLLEPAPLRWPSI